jgi:uncharacterized protein YxjI
MDTTQRFSHSNYLIRRKILSILGAAFHVYDPSGNVAFYSKQKAFKLKEDIRIYTGEDMQTECLLIKARNVIDIAAKYDVFDSATNTKIGTFQRKGLKSILKDEWLILNTNDEQVGMIKEDSALMATLRRFLTNLIPQEFYGFIGESTVLHFKQNFNPFVSKINLDFSSDTNNLLDRRLGIAAGVLLCAVEGKQG